MNGIDSDESMMILKILKNDRSLRRIALAFSVALIVAGGVLKGQPSEPDRPDEREVAPSSSLPFSFGIFGGYIFNAYLGTLDVGADPVLGGGLCGTVGTGFGGGAAFGILGEYRMDDAFSIGARLLWENRSGEMTRQGEEAERRLSNGDLAPVQSTHHFDVSLATPGIEIYGVGERPFSLPFSLVAGLKIGVSSQRDFVLYEELEGDPEITFANGTQRLEFARGMLGRSLMIGPMIGIRRELPMGGGLALIPELTASVYGGGAGTGESSPAIAGLRGSVAIRYTPSRPTPEPPSLPPVEPVPPLPPAAPLVASLVARGISPEGDTRSTLLVVVDEKIRPREVALLPYVFFDESSSDIPPRYLRRDGDDSPVEIYRSLLDIVGQRMSERREGSITLIGTNSGTGEEGGLDLSRRRAESVKRYLVERWKIAAERIDVEARGLPEEPSNSAYPEGEAENRRVEIVAGGDILAPVRVAETEITYSSPGIRFDANVTFSVPFNYWEIRMMLDSSLVRSLKGGEVLKRRIDDTFSENELERLVGGAAISYAMLVQDTLGRQDRSEPGTIGVDVIRRRSVALSPGDSALVFTAPVLFEYNSAMLDAEDSAALGRFRGIFPPDAEITVTGYADDLGEAGYNAGLSLRRAEAVAGVLRGLRVTARGGGESAAPGGSEATPEDRFYARRVEIVIRPAKNGNGGE